jgi:hypothetical protein
MADLIVPDRQIIKPTNGAVITRASNEFGPLIIDGFYGPATRTLRGNPLTFYGTTQPSAYPYGYGHRSSAAGAFSFPCDLSAYNAVTVVFEYVQFSRSGTHVLFEHSADADANAGTFYLYTEDAFGVMLISVGGSGGTAKLGYVSMPALGQKITIAVRMRLAGGTYAADIGVSINGVLVPPTEVENSTSAINFKDDTTYFLARAGTYAASDAVIGGYAVLKGFVSDQQLNSLSRDPWQIFSAGIGLPVFAKAGTAETVTTIGATTANAVGSVASVSTSVSTIGATSASAVGSVTSVSRSASTIAATGANAVGSVSSVSTSVTTIAAAGANAAGTVASVSRSVATIGATGANAVGSVASVSTSASTIGATGANAAGSVSSVSTGVSTITATGANAVGSVASVSLSTCTIAATTTGASGSVASTTETVSTISATTSGAIVSVNSVSTSSCTIAAVTANAVGNVVSIAGVSTSLSATTANAVCSVNSVSASSSSVAATTANAVGSVTSVTRTETSIVATTAQAVGSVVSVSGSVTTIAGTVTSHGDVNTVSDLQITGVYASFLVVRIETRRVRVIQDASKRVTRFVDARVRKSRVITKQKIASSRNTTATVINIR